MELTIENYPEHGYFTAVPLGVPFRITEAGFYTLIATAIDNEADCAFEVRF